MEKNAERELRREKTSDSWEGCVCEARAWGHWQAVNVSQTKRFFKNKYNFTERREGGREGQFQGGNGLGRAGRM